MKFKDYTHEAKNAILQVLSDIDDKIAEQKAKINDLDLLIRKDKILFVLMRESVYRKLSIEMFGITDEKIDSANDEMKEYKIILAELERLRKDLIIQTGYVEDEENSNFTVEIEATLEV